MRLPPGVSALARRLRFEWMYARRWTPWDSGIVPPEVNAFIATHPPGRALDVGCGTGTSAIALAQHGWRVTALDFSWLAIRRAQQKARAAGVEVDFRIADVTYVRDLPYPFDLVLDIGCFHGLSPEAKERYVQQVSTWLRDTGSLLLYVIFNDPGVGFGVTEADLARFAPRLKIIQRADGTDWVRQRRSTWLTLQKVE
ncbi:MAG: class I SAM-dependent methyltransferase [Anaerolineae bacterium]|nr:class I SAM-dependent methyltransferase [Thermoflexales bacterium]MDW8396468.1 class I SAM-dependent methyltransferase [Anaerolineae bacterium]